MSILKILGEFQLDVLRAVATLGADASGTVVRDHLTEEKRKLVHTPQVYSALKKLIELKLVATQETKAPKKRGRPQVIYSLTSTGRALLASRGTIDLRDLHGREESAEVPI